MPKDADRGNTGGTPFRKEKIVMNQIFESLEKTTSRLNETANSANELIRSANERLAAIGAGVAYYSTECVLREESRSLLDANTECQVDVGCESYALAYAKIYGVWQLGVRNLHYTSAASGYAGNYDLVGWDDEPLLSADRELRIKAVNMLPEFLQEYTAYIEKLADELS